MQQPPQQPPFEHPYGEPPQPPIQPPAPNEPTRPVSQPPTQPEPTLAQPTPPTQPAPESAFMQPPSYQEQAPAQPAARPPGPAAGREKWVTFTQLRGHPLIDITAGKTVGVVHDVLLDQQRHTIQAFTTRGGLFHRAVLVPALRATIGADAVTFQPGALTGQDTSWLENLPKVSQLLGMRVLSDTGQLLGTVEEVRLDPESASLAALEMAPEQTGIAHRLGSARRLLAASNVISFGPDTIIVREGDDLAL